jgi:hypothetical protein
MTFLGTCPVTRTDVQRRLPTLGNRTEVRCAVDRQEPGLLPLQSCSHTLGRVKSRIAFQLRRLCIPALPGSEGRGRALACYLAGRSPSCND